MEISNAKTERRQMKEHTMNEIPANLIYNPNELEKWLDS